MAIKKIFLTSIPVLYALCFLAVQKTYATCSCGVASRTYISPSHPPHSITPYHHYRTRKSKKVYNIIWRYQDSETGQSWILVKYIKPTGVGAYMTAPYFEFTQKRHSAPRHFSATWSFQDTDDPKKLHTVYLIKRFSWKKPKSKDEFAYKWVKLDDIRLHPKVQEGSFTDMSVIAKDGSRIWIDQTLARALVKKIYKHII